MDQQLLTTLLARQGIYNKNGSVYAYELLYRDLPDALSSEEKTSHIITQLFSNMDIDNIIGNKKAFINFSYRHLVEKIPHVIPVDRVVIQVKGSVDIDKPLINGLLGLGELGYKIALTDFIFNEKTALLIELADFIKLNVLYQNKQQIARQLESLKKFKGQFIAEKIEDNEQFKDCVDLGFTYFQGFFLNKPDSVKGQVITENKNNLLRLMAELHNEDISMNRVEELVLQVPKLSYRVLRLANSVSLFRGQKIDSLEEALRKLGLNQINNWLYLFLLSSQDDLVPDLLERTLIRAKMCESLAQSSGYSFPHQAYTVGVFSTLDLFLYETMESLLAKISLSEALHEAILLKKGELGTILQAAIDYEASLFNKLDRTPYDNEHLTRAYLQGIEHARSVMEIINH